MDGRDSRRSGARARTWRRPSCERQGMEILDRNWHCRSGELDIVAEDSQRGPPDAWSSARSSAAPGSASATRWRRSRTRSCAGCASSRRSGCATTTVCADGDPARRDRRVMLHRPQPPRDHMRGIGLSLACACSVALVGLDGRHRRGGGAHRPRAAADHPGRAARHLAVRGAGPLQGGGGQLGRRLAELAADHQPVAGDAAEGRAAATTWRSSPRCWRRPTCFSPSSCAAPCCSASSAGRAGAARPRRPAGRRWRLPRPGFRRVDRAHSPGGGGPAGGRASRSLGVGLARAAGRRAQPSGAGRRAPDDPDTTRAAARRCPSADQQSRRLDLADVVGQVEAKWALEVAAAGRHHLLFSGPPGVGKTMLAERLPGLLPDLDGGGGAGGVGGALAGRRRPLRRTDRPPAVRRSAPLGLDGQHRRRRTAAGPARGHLLCPPRRAVPGRGPGVPAAGAGGAAGAAGVRASSAWAAATRWPAIRPGSSS